METSGTKIITTTTKIITITTAATTEHWKQWEIEHLPRITIPGMNWWDILIPHMTCHVKQENK